jgi:hypothetical protein
MTWIYAKKGIVYICPSCFEPTLKAHDSDHGTIYECINRCWIGYTPDEIPESELPE